LVQHFGQVSNFGFDRIVLPEVLASSEYTGDQQRGVNTGEGAVNPSLTVIANALRVADHLRARLI
jgi:hypothetical protein